NYIDPRVVAAWLVQVDLDWKRVYTATLQKKFKWVEEYNRDDLEAFSPYQNRISKEELKVVVSEDAKIRG
ncbi:MAG TPA: hypothetical protein VIX38_02955, partial [Nitrososphaeraceae archaeon]